MEKILNLINEKITEVENDTDYLNYDLTEDYIKGYINGLEMAKIIIIEEF